MRSDQVHIDSPCHESWDAMAGDSERRFCGVCEKHVHNLSAMRHDDAVALLGAEPGERLCVRYAVEDDGSLRFRDLVPRSRLTRGLRRAAFAAVMLAACSPQGNEPIAELADVAVSSIREAAVPTPDGGCNVTTGPFTTFHFPPGHALCGPASAEATVVMQEPAMPAAPVIAVQPIVHVQPMVPAGPLPDPFPAAGEPEPFEPEPFEPAPTVTSERPPMRMGAAVRRPERVDPFEPCDPPPSKGFAPPPPPPSKGFAPPPPRVEPREPPREIMGDIAVPVERPMVQGGIRRADPPPSEPGFAPPPR